MRHTTALVLALSLGAAAIVQAPRVKAAEVSVGIGLPIGVYAPPVAYAPAVYLRPAPWFGVGRYYYGGDWGYPYRHHFYRGGYAFHGAFRYWHGGRR